MKNIVFVSENFQFLEVKFSIYLNRSVFVMLDFKGEFWSVASCTYRNVFSRYSSPV